MDPLDGRAATTNDFSTLLRSESDWVCHLIGIVGSTLGCRVVRDTRTE